MLMRYSAAPWSGANVNGHKSRLSGLVIRLFDNGTDRYVSIVTTWLHFVNSLDVEWLV